MFLCDMEAQHIHVSGFKSSTPNLHIQTFTFLTTGIGAWKLKELTEQRQHLFSCKTTSKNKQIQLTGMSWTSYSPQSLKC